MISNWEGNKYTGAHSKIKKFLETDYRQGKPYLDRVLKSTITLYLKDKLIVDLIE